MAESFCSGQYRAQQWPGNVLILIATGEHNRSGYKVALKPYRQPNSYYLVHEPPPGPSADVITPFCVSTTWSGSNVKTVDVEDAQGKHKVTVEKVLDSTRCEGGDGPFPNQNS